jgi:THO complex subunit 4
MWADHALVLSSYLIILFIYDSQQNQQGGVTAGRGGFRGRGRGNGGGRGNKSGGRGGKKPVEKSAADLDKDLESYHAEAMNIS